MLLKVTQNNKKLIANSTYPSHIHSSNNTYYYIKKWRL